MMKKYNVKFNVVTDAKGEVIGTQQVIEPAAAQTEISGLRASAKMVARPEQKLHEVELELTEQEMEMMNRSVAEFHKLVQSKIEMTK